MKKWPWDVIIISIILAVVLISNKAHATTTSASMNVSGPGSDYIFIFRGNDPAFFDALQQYNPVGWTATCSSGCPQGSYFTISSITYPDPDYMYLYTVDKNGNVAYPESGAWYSFSSPPPPPQPLCCGGNSTPFEPYPTTTSRVQGFVQRTTNNSQVYIDQIGNSNTITIDQSGTKNNHIDYEGNGSNLSLIHI